MTEKEKTRLDWEKRIDDFKESNLSIRKWCELNGFKVHQLQYWLKKFKTIESINGKTNWVKATINVEQQVSNESKIVQDLLILKVGKCELNINHNTDTNLLKEVIKVLIELC